MARSERTIKRLWVLAIILILLFAFSNGAWIYYFSQWEIVETEVHQEVETGQGDAIISGTGDVFYGTSQADGENPEAGA